MTIEQRYSELREKLSLYTYQQVAKEAGVSKNTVARMARGQVQPSVMVAAHVEAAVRRLERGWRAAGMERSLRGR